ncbi:MAG: hypothetical protein ACYTBJ_02360 [Planctomycetota bacterium]|jgi:hypothetical protein
MALSGKSVIRTKIKVDESRKAQADVKGFTDKLQGLTNIAKGSAAGLAAFGPHAAAAAAGIAAIGVAAAGAAKALTLMAQAFVELGRRGATFSAVADRFDQFTSDDQLQRLQELSGWHVRQIDIMRTFNRATETGVISQEQFAEALDLITARAQQTGEDVTQMLERMTPLLQGRGIEQITDLGVQSGVLADALREAGLSAEGAAGQQERLALGLRLAREQIGETNNEVANLGDSWEALNTNVQDYIDNMAEVVSTSPALVDSFEALREGLNNMGITAQSSGVLIAGFMRQIIGMTAFAVREVAELIGGYLEFVKSAGDTIGIDVRRHGLTQAQEQVEQIIATARAVERASISGELLRPAEEGEEQQRRRGRGAGAGGDGPTPQDIADEAFKTRMQQIELMRSAELQGIIDVGEARQALNDTFQRIDEDNLRIETERHERRVEMDREKIESLEAGYEALAEIEAEAAEARTERQDQFFDSLSSYATSTQKIFNSVSTVIGAISGDTEEAARRQGAFLIAFSGVMAAVELAQSIKSFASQDYAAGVAHLASMAAFIAAAAQAASDLGGGSAKAPSAPGGTFTPAAPEQAATPTGEGGGVTIVENYSFGRSGEELGENLRDADWTFQSSGTVSNRGLAAEFGA